VAGTSGTRIERSRSLARINTSSTPDSTGMPPTCEARGPIADEVRGSDPGEKAADLIGVGDELIQLSGEEGPRALGIGSGAGLARWRG
jgi:hypothetical protein